MLKSLLPRIMWSLVSYSPRCKAFRSSKVLLTNLLSQNPPWHLLMKEATHVAMASRLGSCEMTVCLTSEPCQHLLVRSWASCWRPPQVWVYHRGCAEYMVWRLLRLFINIPWLAVVLEPERVSLQTQIWGRESRVQGGGGGLVYLEQKQQGDDNDNSKLLWNYWARLLYGLHRQRFIRLPNPLWHLLAVEGAELANAQAVLVPQNDVHVELLCATRVLRIQF